jgi:hypothetical protein
MRRSTDDVAVRRLPELLRHIHIRESRPSYVDCEDLRMSCCCRDTTIYALFVGASLMELLFCSGLGQYSSRLP